MADRLPTSRYYSNFGGINTKSSKYTTEVTEFLDLRNVDFEVPNALQKRPGSTQAILSAAGIGHSILGLGEYERLSGASWMVVIGGITSYYISGSSLTAIENPWGNSPQPKDLLNFFDTFWMADGRRYRRWDGGVSFGAYNAGLVCPSTSVNTGTSFPAVGLTGFLVAGATMLSVYGDGSGNETFIARGVYVAYSYVRNDGYEGPVDFLSYARNIARIHDGASVAFGAEFFSLAANQRIFGLTVPAFQGITGINIWIATDTVTNSDEREYISEVFGSPRVGNLGWQSYNGDIEWMSLTLKPTADVSRFRLFTSIPTTALFTGPVSFSLYGFSIGWGVTFWPIAPGGFIGGINASFGFWNNYQDLTPFSGMPFCWYNTNTPKYIDVNQNVMFLSGFSNTPSSIWFSEVGEPEIIEEENNFEVRTNDGDRIIGHRTYNGNVIVFKTNSFHKIIGSTPSDFELVELSLEYGCVSNQAIVEFNEKLVFLDKKGVALFDGASWRYISTDVENIFERMNLGAAYEKATAVHYLYRNQIWFGIPVDGSEVNNLTVVWDYLIDAWTFFDGFNPSAFTWAKSHLSKPTVWYGNYSGLIHYFGESFYSDSGRAITCAVFSRFEQWQGENSTNVWRRLFLDVATASGLTGTISGKVYSDYDQSTVRATFQVYQNVFQSKAEMGVVGKAAAFEVSHNSATLPFLMNGYTWVKRYLRNV